ncbi:MAG: 30S ribosomal protein S27e [Candidatus Micrarchaeia archaeon]
MSRFLHVQCDCGQDAIIFGDSKSTVKCKACKKVIARPRGGRAAIEAKILEVLS